MANGYPIDTAKVLTAEELLKSHKSSQVKQHCVLDSQGRLTFAFIASIHAGDGDPCLATEYVYANSTSTTIIARQERAYLWKAAWDSLFTFDSTADYDPDGDGVL